MQLLQPGTGCDGLRNVFQYDLINGITTGMAIHDYICPNAVRGDLEKIWGIESTVPKTEQFCDGDGLIASEDCCICGVDRMTGNPFTYAPTTLSPTAAYCLLETFTLDPFSRMSRAEDRLL